MLTLYFFNVGLGDEIAIHFPNNDWGIIDCNQRPNTKEPSVLTYLKAINVDKLKFICITHPHEDHFKGIDKIVKHYNKNMEHVWLYGLATLHKNEQNDKKSLAKALILVLNICKSIKKNITKVLKRGDLISVGDVGIEILNPTDDILNNLRLYSLDDTKQEFNKASVVFKLHYAGKTIILSGDATKESWIEIIDDFSNRKEKNKLLSNILKVSHHGSKENNTKDVLKNTMQKPNSLSIISSAGGYKSLPSQEVINYLTNERKSIVLNTSDLNTDEQNSSDIPDFKQSVTVNAGISTFTDPHKRIKYDGLIKISINQEGHMEASSINSIQEAIDSYKSQ